MNLPGDLGLNMKKSFIICCQIKIHDKDCYIFRSVADRLGDVAFSGRLFGLTLAEIGECRLHKVK